MKSTSASERPPLTAEERNEQYLGLADDARDIARDLRRSLPDYTGNEEESTARHEMPHDFHVTVNVPHPPQQSFHDAEPASAVPKKWQPLAALGAGLGAALIAGLATLLQRCGH